MAAFDISAIGAPKAVAEKLIWAYTLTSLYCSLNGGDTGMSTAEPTVTPEGVLEFGSHPLGKEEVDRLTDALLKRAGQLGALKILRTYQARTRVKYSDPGGRDDDYEIRTRSEHQLILWRIGEEAPITTRDGQLQIPAANNRYVLGEDQNERWAQREGLISHHLLRNECYEISLEFPLNKDSADRETVNQIANRLFRSIRINLDSAPVLGTDSRTITFALGDEEASKLLYGSKVVPNSWSNAMLIKHARALEYLEVSASPDLLEKVEQAKQEEQDRLIKKAAGAFAVDKAKELQAALDEYENLFGARMSFLDFYPKA